jgi:antitoxin (DNA-binding transcriptional repressor) of toxin-antitoxin stability system
LGGKTVSNNPIIQLSPKKNEKTSSISANSSIEKTEKAFVISRIKNRDNKFNTA